MISVLIPCWNSADYIADTINSVLQQTYQDLEIIVVDDASSDISADIVRSFPSQSVQLLTGDGRGAAAARNRAFAHSKGSHVLFLDGDDLISPVHLEALQRRASEEVGCIAFGEWDRFTDQPSDAAFPARRAYRDGHPVDWLCDDWANGSMTQCGMFLIPRALIERYGGWDERLTLIDDFEFFARLITRCSSLKFAPGAKLFYRSGVPGSLSGSNGRAAAQSAFNSLLWGTNHLLAVEDSVRTREASANVLQRFDYDYYPAYPDLRGVIRDRVAQLGGSNLAPDGPPRFQRLRKWVGWRAARRVQRIVEKCRPVFAADKIRRGESAL